MSETAVLNANYMMNKLKDVFELPYDRICMHEFVLSGSGLKKHGVRTLDLAKRLSDYGYHAPTVYFPLIVDEAIMIEPTETEAKSTLDQFIEVMRQIAKEAEEQPEMLTSAPHNTPVKRVDEARAEGIPFCAGGKHSSNGRIKKSAHSQLGRALPYSHFFNLTI